MLFWVCYCLWLPSWLALCMSLIMITNACHSLITGALWISEDQREEKTSNQCHDLLQRGQLSWLLMCGKMCPLYQTTSVFIFFSFHKGCGLSTFSLIYQQIYLLLLPASVYIQWVSWFRVVYETYGVWLMGVFVTHGFIGLNLTFRCLCLQYLFLEMCPLWVWVFILLLPFRRCFK